MDNNKHISLLKIAGHLTTVIILSLLTIKFIKKEVNASFSDYVSGVGSVASVYGIIIALWQIKQTKNAAMAAENASIKKSKEIDDFMSFANISRHIEISNSILPYLATKQYEAAIIKIDQLKELLIELNESDGISDDERKYASSHVTKLSTDISSIRKQMLGYNILDEDEVVTHIMSVNTFLQEISAKLKRKNYDKREV